MGSLDTAGFLTACVHHLGLAAVACAAQCDCSGAGAYDEPERVAMHTLPECAALCSDDGSVAFAREGGQFRGIVCGILLCGGELGLTRAAVLHVIKERF